MTTNQTRKFMLPKLALRNKKRCLDKFTQAGEAAARDGLIHPGLRTRVVDIGEVEERLLRAIEQVGLAGPVSRAIESMDVASQFMRINHIE